MNDKQQQVSSSGNGIKMNISPKSAKSVIGSFNKDVKKRWTMVGAVGVGVLVVLSSMASGGGEKRAPAKVEPAVVETSPKGLTSGGDWRAQTGAELSEVKNQLAASNKVQSEMASAIMTLRAELQKQREEARKAPANAIDNRTSGGQRLDLKLPEPPRPPTSLTPPAPTYTPPTTPEPPLVATAPTKSQPVVRRAARAFVPSTYVAAAQEEASEVVEMVTNDRQGYLPAGSFADATLLSGVEAFTGGTAQSQPQPLLLRINANAILPNSAAYKIAGCHVLASVWGDMSSERVFGRTTTLTCVDSQNQMVLSEEVEGVLIDSDGKNGIRGELQDRQGAKLARSLLAGFAQGLSSAFGAAQSTVSNTALGTTSAILGPNMAKAGAYQGASTAADQLSDFYLKQAEATLPIIAVDTGRKVSVMFTASKPLKFESTSPYRMKRNDRIHVQRGLQ